MSRQCYSPRTKQKAVARVVAGEAASAVASSMGIPLSNVSRWAQAAGSARHDTIARQRAEAIQLHAQGMKPSAIAERLKVGRSVVSRWLRPYAPLDAAQVKRLQAELAAAHDLIARLQGELASLKRRPLK